MANYYLNQLGIQNILFPGFIPTMPINEGTMLLPSETESSAVTSPVSTSPSSESSPKMVKKEPTSPNSQRIKRPMNAFMVWSQIRRQEISANGGKFHNSDISKMLGAEWRKMADEQKSPFVQKARELREDHFREHPDYVYRPRRRKRNAKVSSTESKNSSTDEPPVDNNSLQMSMLLSHFLYSNMLTQFNHGSPLLQNFNLSPTTPIAPPNPLTF